MKFRSLPIFWQTLALMLVGLAAAQIISVLLILTLPSPAPEAVTMTEIADALSGNPAPERISSLTVAPSAPEAVPGMVARADLTGRLATIMQRQPRDVRLFYVADQSATFPNSLWTKRGLIPVRHGQPYFFNRLVAAARVGPGRWRIFTTPSPPLVSAWQARTSLWFAASAIAMLPFAWAFARRLTQPIRRLAKAVEGLGKDHDDASVPTDGPAELKLTAIALNDMQERLRSNMRERSAMMGAIAHDLRTPLARIAFRIESSAEPVRRAVLQDIDQIHAMIGATVAYLRGESELGERLPVDLAALALGVAHRAIDTGSPVMIGTLDQTMVSGNRLSLERLIENLLDNAIKYAGSAEMHVWRDGDRVVLEIIDDGPGIPEGDIARMFEPFERQDPSRNRGTGGVGLGLSIARAIALAHKGTVSASNRVEGGLTLRLELPIAPLP